MTNGTYVTVHEEFDSGVAEIEFVISSATGTKMVLSTEISTGRSADPVVARLADGNWVVAWTNAVPAGGDIQFQIRRPDGSVATGIRTAATGTDAQNEPVVIAQPEGGFIIAWDNDTTDQLQAQAFDAAGNPDGAQVTIFAGIVSTPDISVTADGRVLFAWRDIGTDEIFSSVWDPRGATITTDNYRRNPRSDTRPSPGGPSASAAGRSSATAQGHSAGTARRTVAGRWPRTPARSGSAP